jgi:hypothetical protein
VREDQSELQSAQWTGGRVEGVAVGPPVGAVGWSVAGAGGRGRRRACGSGRWQWGWGAGRVGWGHRRCLPAKAVCKSFFTYRCPHPEKLIGAHELTADGFVVGICDGARVGPVVGFCQYETQAGLPPTPTVKPTALTCDGI